MIKIDIISGFLGSGKTTLIKKFLDYYKHERVVVVENEFGEIGIDGEVIQKEGLKIIELQNGCICCSMKLNFKDSILKVVKELNPSRIIIEPTGVAMLSEILLMLDDNQIKSYCTINSLITIVDAINYFDYIENFGEFFEDQILNAQILLLSKTQFLKHENLDKTISSLKNLNEDVNIINENWDDLSMEQLIGVNLDIQFDKLKKQFNRFDEITKNMKSMSSLSITNLKIQEIDELKKIFKDFSIGKYGKVLRAKGFLKLNSNNNFEFNYVNGNYDIRESNIDTNSKICIIGSELQKGKLNTIFK